MRKIVVCALVALCACGSSGQSAPPTNDVSLVRAASAATQRAGTVTISMVISSVVSGHTISFTGTGVEDFAKREGSIILNSPGGRVRSVVTAHYVYENIGALGSKWFRISLSKLTGNSTDPFGFSSDPAGSFTSMLQVAKSVTGEGTVTVRGVPTSSYRVILDQEKILAHLPAKLRATFSSSPVDFSKMPMTVDIDAQKLVRRLEMTMDLLGTKISYRIDMYDYGKPVHIEIPPASDVTSAPRGLGY